MRDPLDELTTNPRVPVADAIVASRIAVREAVADILAIDDSALEAPWRWRPEDARDIDIRFGCYRPHEILLEAADTIARARMRDPAGHAPHPALPPLVATGTARWELHGALAALPDGAWDADPGGGEWTVRRTVAHVISAHRAYGWTNAWFLDRAGTPEAGEYAPDGALPPEPDEETEGDGSRDEVERRLDGLVDQAIEVLGTLDEDALGVPGRWYRLPVSLDFRLGRLGSHIREHTIQVDKTLALLGIPIREVDRLARLTLATYGQVEGLVIGRPTEEVSADLAILQAAAADAARTAADARAAAERARG
jgi:hypothetical protein